MIDFEIERCTRHCAVTGRELKPGEEYYTVLIDDDEQWRRLDYSAEAWQGPPDDCVAWWRARIPPPSGTRKHWAPDDVMLHCLEELEGNAERADFRYVLALLMMRRRILRLEGTERMPDGSERATFYCPKRDAAYTVPVVLPDEDRLQGLQEEIHRLFSGGAGGDAREMQTG